MECSKLEHVISVGDLSRGTPLGDLRNPTVYPVASGLWGGAEIHDAEAGIKLAPPNHEHLT